MKRVFYVFIGILTLFVYADIVKADSCSLEEKVRYTEIASNVKVSYEENEVKNVVGNDPIEGTFYNSVLDLKIYNATSDLSFILTDGVKNLELSSKNADKNGVITVRINNVDEIRNYSLEIYPSAYNCYTSKVRTLKVTLPKYNYESVSELCSGITDYYLCQKFVFSNFDHEFFNTGVEDYRSKLDGQKGNVNLLDSNDNNGKIDSIVATASKYKYVIAIAIIVVGVVATIIVIKKKGSATK